MPNNETAKTKSAPKRRGWIILFCAVAGLLIYTVVALALHKSQDAPTVPAAGADGKVYTLVTESPGVDARSRGPQPHGKAYHLTAVVSAAAQVKGLSGTERLAGNAGMLFLYNEVGERCFWMKDMRYALDIIWLDAQKRVVHIEPDLTPDTYPQSYCAPAKYGIELNAGEAAKSGIAKGQILSF